MRIKLSTTKVLTIVAVVVFVAMSISSFRRIKLSRPNYYVHETKSQPNSNNSNSAITKKPNYDIDQYYNNQLRGGDDSGSKGDDIDDERGDRSDDVNNIIIPATLPEDDVEQETSNDSKPNDDGVGETTTSRRLLPKMISFEYTTIDNKKPDKTWYYSSTVRWTAIEYRNLKVSPLTISSYDEELNNNDVFQGKNSIPSHPPIITKAWYSPNAQEYQMEGYNSSACEPMYDWQLKSYPSCNNVHELDLQQMRLINSGGSRVAFETTLQTNNNKNDGRRRHESKFVYKTIKYSMDVDIYKVEEQRRDSLVMERTTSSNFIPDIYGYCSVAVLMDFMPEGSMHDYIKGARATTGGRSTLSPVDRLKLAIHITTSVADLHTIDNTPLPSIFHNDICCHQYLFQNGIFKLNDFNYARAIYKNKETNESCTRSRFGMAMWKGRSLEEHQLETSIPDLNVKPDKVDGKKRKIYIFALI